MKSKLLKRLPSPVRRDIDRLATTVRSARVAKGLTQTDVASRLQISPVTVQAIERADPAVALGIWASVLWLLGVGLPSSVAETQPAGRTGARASRKRMRPRAPEKPLDEF